MRKGSLRRDLKDVGEVSLMEYGNGVALRKVLNKETIQGYSPLRRFF